jgi:hypothetical protein
MPPAPRRPGIFCLETSWNKRLDDKTSVLPILDLLHRTDHARYIHRDVGTSEELTHYLKKWRQAQYSDYEVLYFAFHGTRGAIDVGPRGASVPLVDLADTLEGRAANRVVVFASCETIKDTKAVEDFRRRTKAKAVCGYSRQVDWIQATAFELVLLGSLVSGQRIDARINHLQRNYADQVKALGFKVFRSSTARGIT